jgi:hypothetical protein
MSNIFSDDKVMILGLDISKLTATYWLLDTIPNDPKHYAKTKPQKSIKVSNAGKAELLKLSFDFAVMEPTGVYSRIWRHWLKEAGKQYRMVGHKELAHYREGWKLQKTDKLDGLAMCLYGLERQHRPAAWLVERDYRLSDLCHYLTHLNRQKNGYQNNLRQRLVSQIPEWHEREIKRQWGRSVPGILKAINGSPSNKWQQEIEESCGSGIGRETASLSRILIAIEEEEILVESWIDEELALPQYQPYMNAARRCGFSTWLTACMIAAIYPFEQFLDAGKRRWSRSLSKEKGLPVKKDESLRAFKMACGMGLVWIQSGDFAGWTAGGDGDIRMILRNSIKSSYLNNKKEIKQGKVGDKTLELVKSKYDNHGMMKVARRWIEKFYKELLNERDWSEKNSGYLG